MRINNKQQINKIISCLCIMLFSVLHLGSQNNNEPLFTFGIVADVQYADRDNSGTRYYRSSPSKLANAVNAFNQQDVAFVLSLGDFINDGFHHLDTLDAITDKLNMPLYHVLGNHDFLIYPHRKKDLFSALNMNQPYYSFVKSKWRFIILDGNDISLYAHTEGSEKHRQASEMLKTLLEKKAPNAREWNGGIGEKQLIWLNKELITAQRKKEQVIIVCHFPLYSDHASGLLLNATDVRTLIETYPNVIAYLNGHVHKSEYFLENGVHYISFRGMVEEEVNAYSVISVFNDYLEIENRDIKLIGK